VDLCPDDTPDQRIGYAKNFVVNFDLTLNRPGPPYVFRGKGGRMPGVGDDDAELLRALHAEHGDALFAHALRLNAGDRQRAEDLVQETMLRAWQHPEALDPARGSIRAWLFTTARNLAIDNWRRRSARVGEVITDAPPELPMADETDRAVESWIVAEALQRLSPQHREVLVECYYQGRSVNEAAGRLGVPPGTVKSRTYYALRSLKLVLEELGVTP
jgi:RNA polymerase sigma-70 factor (ECF subfamily)